MKVLKKILMVITSVFMACMLSSCTVIAMIGHLVSNLFGNGDISFEYKLTEDDLTEFTELLNEFEKLAMRGTDVVAINVASADMMEKYEYIEAQEYAGYIEYCLDQTNETAIKHYTESEAIATEMRTQYRETLKRLAQGSAIKDELFAGWSEEELNMLFVDNEAISALQLENSEIAREYYALEENESWSNNVNALYEQTVINNQLIAVEYGYENYYEFGSDMIYGRGYTEAQRADFREYVAEYILPLFTQAYEQSRAVYATLTSAQLSEYSAIYSSSEYLHGYIDSYSGSLHDKMNAMLERENAAIFATGENAYQGAFVNYISYYDQPFAYFGPGYQDLFTIVHEMGHYTSLYHFDLGMMPYDLAETHSQGNEWMLLAYLKDLVDPTVFEALCLDNLANGLATVILSTLVDHFEELVYTAETPIKASEYEALMASVCAHYEGVETVLDAAGIYAPFQYAQYVVLPAPVYYMNYATSQVASISLYAIAQASGYEVAQKAYVKLQEGVDPTSDFFTAVTAAGLLDPFSETTYTRLTSTFFAKPQA